MKFDWSILFVTVMLIGGLPNMQKPDTTTHLKDMYPETMWQKRTLWMPTSESLQNGTLNEEKSHTFPYQ